MTEPLPLTPRQIEIREFIARGWSSKEIANKLGLSSRTVEDHRRDIFERMAVRNVAEMMRVMYRLDEMDAPATAPANPGADVEAASGEAVPLHGM